MKKITKAVFPVAGMGSRFLPATKVSPKEMMPIVDKPLIQYAVEEAVAAGITDMVFITGRNKRSIEDHFDKAYELEAELAMRGKDELLRIVREVTPYPIKVAATRGYGAEVILHGPTSTEAFAEMFRLRGERNLTFIHPFDSDRTLAGTGTIGLEILEDVPDVDTVVVGIGGGGLIGGIATAIGEAKPSARVIGVEPTGADAMTRSLAAGAVVHLDHVETIADGLAPPFVGELPLAQVRRYVENVVVLTDDEIKEGMRFLIERCKLVAEPAGAAATAAVLLGKLDLRPGEKVAIIVSGGNIAPTQLKEWL